MDSLDTFGSFFIKNFRDKSLDNLQGYSTRIGKLLNCNHSQCEVVRW
jgi:hypothetical protein